VGVMNGNDTFQELENEINQAINEKANMAGEEIRTILEKEIKNETKSMIVGGEVAEVNRYPYMVALLDCKDKQFCGGSLIAPDWVLSAAHCKGLVTHVNIGRHDLKGEGETFETIEIDFERKHPFYVDLLSMNFDFLLIKLKEPSSYTPIKLDTGFGGLTWGTPVTVIGYGLLVPDSLITNPVGTSILHEVEVNIVPNNLCRLSYGPFDITSQMVCARGLFKDSCQGDSGGPLIIKGESPEEDVQVGIVSWGQGCANPLFPGVYARVSRQTNWIERVTGETISELKRWNYKFTTWLDRIAKKQQI